MTARLHACLVCAEMALADHALADRALTDAALPGVLPTLAPAPLPMVRDAHGLTQVGSSSTGRSLMPPIRLDPRRSQLPALR